MQSIEQISEAVHKRIEFERPQVAPEPEPEPEIKEEPEALTSEEILKALHRNEDGDAELFIRLHRARLVYDHAEGKWYIFRGHYWEPDTKEEALAGVADIADLYVTEMKKQAWARAGAEKAGQTRTADTAKYNETMLARRVRELQTIRRKQAVLHLARAGAEGLGITGDEWDGDDMSLPVLNGVIDLSTGILRKGEPIEYFKTYAPTRFEGINAPCTNWDAGLNSTFGGNNEIIAFMGRLLGYCITGKTTEAVLPIAHGPGAMVKLFYCKLGRTS